MHIRLLIVWIGVEEVLQFVLESVQNHHLYERAVLRHDVVW